MDVEGIMLSEVSQTGKDKYWMVSGTCQIYKIKQASACNKKEADSQI